MEACKQKFGRWLDTKNQEVNSGTDFMAYYNLPDSPCSSFTLQGIMILFSFDRS